MDQTAARQPLNTSRLLIEAAEKILDPQHGEGYAATHPDEVSEFLMSVARSKRIGCVNRLALRRSNHERIAPYFAIVVTAGLVKVQPFSTLDARRMGIMNSAQRVSELCKRGHPIDTIKTQQTDEHGHTHCVAMKNLPSRARLARGTP